MAYEFPDGTYNIFDTCSPHYLESISLLKTW